MIIKWLSNLFKRIKSPNAKRIEYEQLLYSLKVMVNGMGPVGQAISQGKNSKEYTQAQKSMYSKLMEFEKSPFVYQSAELSYYLGLGFRNYCAWFVRGDARKSIYTKALQKFKRAFEIDDSHTDAKSEFALLLIEQKVVRDLSLGIKILEQLNSQGKMPSHLDSILAKARRWSGENTIDKDFSLKKFLNPTPAVFTEERTKLRAIIREAKKNGQQHDLDKALSQLYLTGVLFTMCYGEHDSNSGVSGFQYEEAWQIVNRWWKHLDQSYSTHGIILGSKFISQNDWRTFNKVYGTTCKKFDPRSLLHIKQVTNTSSRGTVQNNDIKMYKIDEHEFVKMPKHVYSSSVSNSEGE